MGAPYEDQPADVRLAWIIDDYEKQRSSAFRKLDEQHRLLSDAMYALESDALDTAMEFLERAEKIGRETRDDLRQPPEPKGPAK